MTERKVLTIRIRDKLVANESNAYEVIATLDPGDVTVESSYRPADISQELIDQAILAFEEGSYSAPETKTLGQILFDALFTGEIREVYEHLVSPRIRLIVDLNSAKRVPWELLHDGHTFVTARAMFSRGISTKAAAAPLKADLPLRVLVVDAFPEGAARLESQLEVASIEQALDQLGSDKVQVATISGVTVKKLEDALDKAGRAGQPFHVLHFIGHGEHRSIGHGHDLRTVPVLLFEDEVAGTHGDRPAAVPVDPEGFLGIVGGDSDLDDEPDLKLVFLNSCRSAQPVAFSTSETFAEKLLEAGIPAVIGMQNAIFDDTAVSFAASFYEELADMTPIDEALSDARAVDRAIAPDLVSDIGVPALYMRSRTGRLFEWQEPARSRRWSRRWIHEAESRIRARIEAVLVYVGLATLIAGLATAVIARLAEPGPIGGDFNVGVASFAEIGSVSELAAMEATLLPRQLVDVLRDALPCAPQGVRLTACRGPDEVPSFGPDESDDAGTHAEDIEADLFVYGSVTSSEDFAIIAQPVVYLSARNLPRAEELTGHYPLRTVRSSSSEELVREAIVDQASALSNLARALNQYKTGDVRAALATVQDLVASGQHSLLNEPLVFVLMGNLYGSLHSRASTNEERDKYLIAAETAYNTALQLDDTFARAWLGLSEVAYQQSLAESKCESRESMQPSIDLANQAVAAARDSESAAIEAKAAFFRGRSMLCVALATQATDLGNADSELLAVVTASQLKQPVPGIGTYAAQSLSLLAESAEYQALREPERVRRHAGLEDAARLKIDAIGLTEDPAFKAAFLYELAQIYGSLAVFERSAVDDACSSLDRAKALVAEALIRFTQDRMSPDPVASITSITAEVSDSEIPDSAASSEEPHAGLLRLEERIADLGESFECPT